ncbi:uncharacterized protein LOC129716097 [Leucoraja erinacea]|uniref:uncharacterized protein LOC129716097 n=1 Tax=Leucoraja erinaceus TaxID=7782 RepID=UPI002458F44A|nr:uncharacterized protein LOC129716097 [Leucoraja erinacea]
MGRPVDVRKIITSLFSIGSLLSLFFFASGCRVSVSVLDREVNGTVGRSALLASCYSTPDPCSQLRVEWRLHPSTTPLVSLNRPNCTSYVRLSRSNCPPHTDRPACNCSVRWVASPSLTGRVQLYPENGSLLLRDLRRSDSGVYEISVYTGGNSAVKDNVTLTVYNHHTVGTTTEYTPTGGTAAPPNPAADFGLRAVVLGSLTVFGICLCAIYSCKARRDNRNSPGPREGFRIRGCAEV